MSPGPYCAGSFGLISSEKCCVELSLEEVWCSFSMPYYNLGLNFPDLSVLACHPC